MKKSLHIYQLDSRTKRQETNCLRVIFFVLYLILGLSSIWGQNESTTTDCEEKLEIAQIEISRGNPDKASELIVNCLESYGTSNKEIAYSLLIEAYIRQEKYNLVKKYLVSLLDFNPIYRFDTISPVFEEIRISLDRLKAQPDMYFHTGAGVNSLSPYILNNYRLDQFYTNAKNYQAGTGFHMYSGLEFPLGNREFRAGFTLGYSALKYSMDQLLIFDPQTVPSLLTLTEKQDWFSLEGVLTYHFDDKTDNYNFDRKEWIPYVGGGIGFAFLAASNLDPIRRDNLASSSKSGFTQGKLIETRHRLNYYGVVKAGIKRKLTDNLYLKLGISYERWFRNIVDPEKRFALKELQYILGHLDDDFSLNVFKADLGIEFSIFDIKAKEKP